MFSPIALRRQFPALADQALIYLDNASTTQKPEKVFDAIRHFYVYSNANPNRGVYPLADAATTAYENARKTVAKFIGAETDEIIFTHGTTEGINLVARSFGEMMKSGDRIALTMMEHHSNIVPWLQLQDRSNIKLDWIAIDTEGQPNLDQLKKVLAHGKTKLLTITGLSNVLGSLPDLPSIISLAHKYGALVCVDAAQMIAHSMIDVRKVDCDFLAFSGHKTYGPMGIGVLYGKKKLLEALPSFLGGGDMIRSVTKENFTTAELPRKFEAGTPSAVAAIGLATAIEWMNEVGNEEIHQHEAALIAHALEKLQSINGLTILGTKDPKKRKGCISFTVEGIHPHDLTQILGEKEICLRAGHHCTQPLHDFLKINASARMSVAAYNTMEEIDSCVEAIQIAITRLKK